MRTKIITYDLSKWIPEPHVLRYCRKQNFNLGRKADNANKSAIADRLEGNLCSQTGILLIIQEGDKIVGWGLCSDTAHVCATRIEFQMYVPVSQRGKGLGKKILKKATQLCGKVRVFVTDQNESFYKRCGVTPYGTLTGKLIK